MNVVWLHGFGENASVWQDLLPHLNSSFPSIVLDYSLESDCQTVEKYADCVKQELDKYHLKDVCLIGHSMGGYIALAFAEKYPKMMKGLCLFNSTSYADTEERKATRTKTMDFIEKHGSAAFIKDFFPNMFTEEFKKAHPAFIQQKISEYSSFPKEALIAATHAMRERPDQRSILKKSTFPILIIAGKKDKFIPYESLVEQNKLLKNPRLLTLEETAHAGMYENPELCIEKINAFITEIV